MRGNGALEKVPGQGQPPAAWAAAATPRQAGPCREQRPPPLQHRTVVSQEDKQLLPGDEEGHAGACAVCVWGRGFLPPAHEVGSGGLMRAGALAPQTPRRSGSALAFGRTGTAACAHAPGQGSGAPRSARKPPRPSILAPPNSSMNAATTTYFLPCFPRAALPDAHGRVARKCGAVCEGGGLRGSHSRRQGEHGRPRQPSALPSTQSISQGAPWGAHPPLSCLAVRAGRAPSAPALARAGRAPSAPALSLSPPHAGRNRAGRPHAHRARGRSVPLPGAGTQRP